MSKKEAQQRPEQIEKKELSSKRRAAHHDRPREINVDTRSVPVFTTTNLSHSSHCRAIELMSILPQRWGEEKNCRHPVSIDLLRSSLCSPKRRRKCVFVGIDDDEIGLHKVVGNRPQKQVRGMGMAVGGKAIVDGHFPAAGHRSKDDSNQPTHTSSQHTRKV